MGRKVRLIAFVLEHITHPKAQPHNLLIMYRHIVQVISQGSFYPFVVEKPFGLLKYCPRSVIHPIIKRSILLDDSGTEIHTIFKYNDLRLRAYRYYATPLLLLPPKSTSSQHANCSRTLFRTYSNDASAVYTQTVRPESVSTQLNTSRQGPTTELHPSAKSVYFLIIKWAKARDPVAEAVEEEAKLVPLRMM